MIAFKQQRAVKAQRAISMGERGKRSLRRRWELEIWLRAFFTLFSLYFRFSLMQTFVTAVKATTVGVVLTLSGIVVAIFGFVQVEIEEKAVKLDPRYSFDSLK